MTEPDSIFSSCTALFSELISARHWPAAALFDGTSAGSWCPASATNLRLWDRSRGPVTSLLRGIV